LHGNSTSR